MAKHYQAPLSMPWYPRDFETDEVVMFMTLEETGAYIRILNHIMIEGSAPTDPEALAVICRTTPDCIVRVWPRISQKFRKSARDSSRIENPKINMIRRLQKEKKRKESEGGKRGAGQKWKEKAKGINSQDGVPHPSVDDHPIPTTDDYKEKEKEKLKEKEKENTTTTQPPLAGADLLAWPESVRTIVGYHPDTDGPMARQIIALAVAEDPEIPDAELARGLGLTHKRNQESAALWLHTIGAWVRNTRKQRDEARRTQLAYEAAQREEQIEHARKVQANSDAPQHDREWAQNFLAQVNGIAKKAVMR